MCGIIFLFFISKKRICFTHVKRWCWLIDNIAQILYLYIFTSNELNVCCAYWHLSIPNAFIPIGDYVVILNDLPTLLTYCKTECKWIYEFRNYQIDKLKWEINNHRMIESKLCWYSELSELSVDIRFPWIFSFTFICSIG